MRFLRKIALSLAIAPSSSSSSSRSPLHCESCLPDECGRGSNHALVKTVHCHGGSTAGGYEKQCCYPSGVFSIQNFNYPARGNLVVVMVGSSNNKYKKLKEQYNNKHNNTFVCVCVCVASTQLCSRCSRCERQNFKYKS